jgi:Domain of unknown function (DUF1840)
MIYKFKSKATGDVIMLPGNGDQLLRAIGRAPAAKGIIEPADMPAAIAALQAAIAADEQPPENEDKPAPVGLRQRFWPMVEMLRRAQSAGEAVVWGV